MANLKLVFKLSLGILVLRLLYHWFWHMRRERWRRMLLNVYHFYFFYCFIGNSYLLVGANQKEEKEELGRIWIWRWKWSLSVFSAGRTAWPVSQTKTSSTAMPRPGTREQKEYICIVPIKVIYLIISVS